MVKLLEDSLPVGQIVLIVALALLGVIVLIALYFVLDKYYFSKRRCAKNLRSLERKYSYLHSLLTGQDYQYVQRIEVISRTNLLYAETYKRVFSQYRDIVENRENAVQEVLNNLAKLLDKVEIKGFRSYYRQSQEIIDTYEEAVNNFNNELMNVIKPEEEARQNSLTLKDKFRELKHNYNAHEAQLIFVSETFERIFVTVDEKFTSFDALLESADYKEANEILPEIKKVIETCNVLIDRLPILIERTNEIVPSKVDETNTLYMALIQDGFQLKNIGWPQVYASIDRSLDDIRALLKKLKVNGIKDSLDELEVQINKVNESFKKEQDAAEEFRNNNQRVYDDFNNVNQDFIKCRNNLSRYTKYYIIDQDHRNELVEIQKQLNDVEQNKRRLDMYLHSSEKTAFTTLIVKMREVDAGNKKVIERFEAFRHYLDSLKTDTEHAFKTINELYFKNKEYQMLLRDFANKDYSDKYIYDFEKAYKLIDEIYIILKTIPIDVNAVNSNLNELVEKTNYIYSRADEANKYREESLSEIMNLNEERVKFSDVNVKLEQAENLFINGEYAKSYQMIGEIKANLQSRDNLTE